MFCCVSALQHEGSESAADDLGGHAGLQQEEGNGQRPLTFINNKYVSC